MDKETIKGLDVFESIGTSHLLMVRSPSMIKEMFGNDFLKYKHFCEFFSTSFEEFPLNEDNASQITKNPYNCMIKLSFIRLDETDILFDTNKIFEITQAWICKLSKFFVKHELVDCDFLRIMLDLNNEVKYACFYVDAVPINYTYSPDEFSLTFNTMKHESDMIFNEAKNYVNEYQTLIKKYVKEENKNEEK